MAQILVIFIVWRAVVWLTVSVIGSSIETVWPKPVVKDSLIVIVADANVTKERIKDRSRWIFIEAMTIYV